jgi:1-acyl-sn-glycerol-3-phosphate acyltransferase
MRPTEEQLKLLSKKERKIFNLTHKLHTKYRKFTIKWQARTGRFFTRITIARRIRIHNIEHLKAIKENSKVIIVANHRTYFDFFPVSYATIGSTPSRMQYFFPVRSNFFYERTLGLCMNFIIASISMFPPIMRDKKKKAFNQYSLKFLENELNDVNQGTIVGIHPEGKRSKLEDPHQLLPGKNGIGKIIKNAPDSTIVIPLFTHGLSNNLWHETKKNYKRKIDAPIDVLFGKPIQFKPLQGTPSEKEHITNITQQCMEAIRELAEKHKDLIHTNFSQTETKQPHTTH